MSALELSMKNEEVNLDYWIFGFTHSWKMKFSIIDNLYTKQENSSIFERKICGL